MPEMNPLGCTAEVPSNIDLNSGRCHQCNAVWIRNDFTEGYRPCQQRLTAPDYLEAAAGTFRERNALYGNNYQRQGAAILALFPEGGIPAITNEEDANRMHVFSACVTKLMRYAACWAQGGHKDSARDLSVYGSMLEEFTDEKG